GPSGSECGPARRAGYHRVCRLLDGEKPGHRGRRSVAGSSAVGRCYPVALAIGGPMDETTRKLADSIADRYELVRELGAGGMARVYLATDRRHGREVAIKVMRPELSASLGAERFQREIRLLARLQHPHILGLVDSGEADGVLYYVMPYLAGGSLRARLERDGELPLEEALLILREIADALVHAQEAGIVHRHIKPENVLFSAGHVQIADFGIARFVDADESSTTLTAAGVVVGSPPYMAPEQVTGSKADSRTDLYALGALAYEMIRS